MPIPRYFKDGESIFRVDGKKTERYDPGFGRWAHDQDLADALEEDDNPSPPYAEIDEKEAIAIVKELVQDIKNKKKPE